LYPQATSAPSLRTASVWPSPAATSTYVPSFQALSIAWLPQAFTPDCGVALPASTTAASSASTVVQKTSRPMRFLSWGVDATERARV
jgi:hypothetical protein